MPPQRPLKIGITCYPSVGGSGILATTLGEELAARGARIVLQGHQPVAAAVKALHDCYAHLYNGGAPADLKNTIASAQEMEEVTMGDTYRKWQNDYLR